VYSANLDVTNEDLTAAIAQIVESDADLVALQEIDTNGAEQLAGSAALAVAFPHQLIVPARRGRGLALLSRLPFVETEPVELLPGRSALRAQIAIEDEVVTIWTLHPASPRTSADRRLRDQELDSLRRRLDDSTLVVIAGDLNATTFHPALRRFFGAGFRDAHAQAGNALAGTWPASRLWPIRVAIDHVLVGKGVGVVGTRQGRPAGSDHVPVVVDLRV
jgi:endonuclease/exonuclease/phosphatase (EEP) superfamily protein YafD